MKESIKKNLMEFKNLPKYQLERRLDIFILDELENALSKIYDREMKFLYPEFPLHLIDVEKYITFKQVEDYLNGNKEIEEVSNNRNSNADYLFTDEECFYLVELKTDSGSFKEYKQVLYYCYYSQKKFKELYQFFRDKLAVEGQDKKWGNGCVYLNDKIKEIFSLKTVEEIEDIIENKSVKIIYITPKAVFNEPLCKRVAAAMDLKENVSDERNDKFQFDFISLGEIAENIEEKNLKAVLDEIEKNDKK